MKAQAALEFLMTYGWAILIVIAVVAALYAMGVFRLPTGGLSKCSPCFPPGAGLAYRDHNADSIVLTVGPNKVKDVVVRNGADTADLTNTETSEKEPGSLVTLNCLASGCLSGDVDIVVKYTDAESGLTHKLTARLHGA